MPSIRSAIDYAEETLDLRRLLLDRKLEAGAGDVFLERMGQLINLSRSGQLAIKRVLADHLERIDRDPLGQPQRLYPFVPHQRSARTVVIDPRISYGRPVIDGRGVTTKVLVERLDAGESIADLMADYSLEQEESEEGLLYESVAA